MNNRLIPPTSDFNSVRDGRASPDFYFDLDLTAVFDTVVQMAGNSFYIDANPSDGVCTAFFQDTASDSTPTPFYISPGFIARIPFTQIRFWNPVAQPGKKIRVIYGTDTEFQPGSVTQLSVSQATPEFSDACFGFGRSVAGPATAGNISAIILANIGATNIKVDTLQIGCETTVAAANIFTGKIVPTGTTPSSPYSKNTGSLDAEAETRQLSNAASIGLSANFGNFPVLAGQFAVEFKNPVIVAPGEAFAVITNGNSRISVSAQYRRA